MASPIITIHDAAGTLIPDGTPVALPVATAGTPTAETVISVRNNAAAGPAVDDATNRVLSILGRIAGTSDDPTADGLTFLVSRALEVRVSAVSGGADAAITGYRPLGTNRRLSLGTIPDGGIVTLGVRCNASLASSLVDVEVYLSVDGLQTTPLPDGAFEALGNFVYDGRPGAGNDADFSEIYSITGALAPDSPNDDSVDIWTEIVYALAGVWYTFAPSPAEIVFTAVDGDAATLLAGEAYYAAITLDGTSTPNITKGSKDTTPLTDADKPTPPAGEFLAGWVVVPFGLVITTVEDVADLDFFGYRGASGLDVTIGPGRGAVGGRWWYSQTPTTITLADDSVSTIYVVPSGGFEAVVAGGSPTDSQSMAIWAITTASGAVTVTTDLRRIGPGDRGVDLYQASYVVDAPSSGSVTVHVQLETFHGLPVASAQAVTWYLATDSAGLTPATVAPNGGTAAGTDGALIESITDLSGIMVSEADGDVDVVVTESVSATTFYLVISIGGRLYVSSAITPTP